MTATFNLREERESLARIRRARWERECRGNLLAFCIEALAPMNQAPARHHRLMIDYLEKVEAGEIDRLMILMPPGHAKSTYGSVLFPAWFYAQAPHRDLIGASHASSLAEDFSKRIQVQIRHNASLLGYDLTSENVESWRTTNGGVYRAAGVGGAITGRRSDLTLIDDPIKGSADAESETVRESQWNWYQSEVYTRRKPGSRIVLIQCMTGDTPVRMADGSERRLDAIVVGDAVATHDRRTLSTARVLGWKAQGEDDIYEMRMSSGRAVRANARHPFLVKRGNLTEWVSLRNLRPGEHIVALPAPPKGVLIQRGARGFAKSTTGGSDGPRASGRRLSTARAFGLGMCAIATGSNSLRLTRCCSLKVGSARFAASLPRQRTCGRIGGTDSASTTITELKRCADSFAMTATYCSLMGGTIRRFFEPPLNTSKLTSPGRPDFSLDEIVSIVPAGRAPVYDVQIERTENFIANGLVSHNTRWHPDDLGGRLIQAQADGGDQWTVLKLPAICDSLDDPLGRKLGEALWPEWQDETELARIRSVVGEYVWGALYQQDPRPRGASFFNIDDLLVPAGGDLVGADGNPLMVPVPMPDRCDAVYVTIDTAIKAGQKHNSTAAIWWSYNSLLQKAPVNILDWTIVQIEGADQADWLPQVHARGEELAVQCGARRGYAGAMIEDKATGTVLLQQSANLRDRGQNAPAYPIDSKLTAMGKEERAIAASPYVIAGDVKITDEAYNKTCVLKGRSANHFIVQWSGFRLGSKETDGLDLLDCGTYGVLMGRGSNSGDGKGI